MEEEQIGVCMAVDSQLQAGMDYTLAELLVLEEAWEVPGVGNVVAAAAAVVVFANCFESHSHSLRTTRFAQQEGGQPEQLTIGHRNPLAAEHEAVDLHH